MHKPNLPIAACDRARLMALAGWLADWLAELHSCLNSHTCSFVRETSAQVSYLAHQFWYTGLPSRCRNRHLAFSHDTTDCRRRGIPAHIRLCCALPLPPHVPACK